MTTTLATLAHPPITPLPDGKPLDIAIAQPGILVVFMVGFLLFLVVRRQIVKRSL